MKTTRIVRPLLPLLLIAAIAPTPGATARAPFTEITATPTGRGLLAVAAERAREWGGPGPSSKLRVWELAPGDYFLADRLPLNLRTAEEHDLVTGRKTSVVVFDIEARIRAPQTAAASVVTAATPSWWWLTSYCFKRVKSTFGWSDSCYSLHGMVNETDPRDFYTLNHFATLGAFEVPPGSQLFSGFVDAYRASTSAPMSWIDWSPRSTISGGCQGIPLSVTALGVSLNTSGVMCERWNILKSASAGGFRTTWSCGCFAPFGVEYPGTRQAEYLQTVSVPNGGVPRWTISTGFHAR